MRALLFLCVLASFPSPLVGAPTYEIAGRFLSAYSRHEVGSEDAAGLTTASMKEDLVQHHYSNPSPFDAEVPSAKSDNGWSSQSLSVIDSQIAWQGSVHATGMSDLGPTNKDWRTDQGYASAGISLLLSISVPTEIAIKLDTVGQLGQGDSLSAVKASIEIWEEQTELLSLVHTTEQATRTSVESILLPSGIYKMHVSIHATAYPLHPFMNGDSTIAGDLVANLSIAPVPEPSSSALAGLGALGYFAATLMRRRFATQTAA
jgi:hypothetical protein